MIPEPGAWGNLLRDLLVLTYMFATRIGVPILITWGIGHWLRQRLQATEHQPIPPLKIEPAETRHCWEVKKCDPATREQCPAYQKPALPCWLALQVSGQTISPQCYACQMFAQPSPAASNLCAVTRQG